MVQKWDVVIVGGGLAGYVAANFLAKTPLNVLLLEKAKQVGGRARTDIINHQLFNLGPHALYKKGMARTILEELNITLEGNTPKLGGILIENNTKYVAPFSPLGLFKTTFLNWKERKEWVSILIKIKNSNRDELDTKTFHEWVHQSTNSEKVRSLLYIIGRLATYCHAPHKVSAYVVISHIQYAIGGVTYLDGGWQTMIDQLHNQAVISGVEIQTKSNMKQIVKNKSDQFQLTLSNGDCLQTKHVLYTGAPDNLNNVIAESFPYLQRNFLEEIVPVKAATLDVALEKLAKPKQLFAMGITTPYYYSVHSKYARLSQSGQCTILHVLKYHHPDERIFGRQEQTNLEAFLNKIQPGWQEYEVARRFLPQITVNYRLPQVGERKNFCQSETHISGLFIAGDWASPDSILSEGAVESGKKAAIEIMQKEGRSSHAT
ncbi:NAD(P)-binding protein [Agaribacter marinus]|uniref:NAD(P)/FAD-dependent oxidoreductase n=1 Tax=Virgibacillus salarius TaxID=447199 RepID=A0A941ICP4_9BACI|nr:FAD-dependent oxidoreductase [Virgibacillus salarius]MBR7797597.1 NAD(P)/FAD-dependent oxidoreductase [Virgibacillus salarius]NAZ10306.1 NAD(P)-binding protein [Agaribacter marinus]